MSAELARALEASLSADAKARHDASEWLEQYKQSNRGGFMRALALELQNVERNQQIRQQAGLQLKNSLTGQHDNVRDEDIQNWMMISHEDREAIKQAIVGTLGTEQGTTSTAAQVIAAIALIEIPQNSWMDVVPNLLNMVGAAAASEAQKVAGLQAVGYITDDITKINPDLLTAHANTLLTTIMRLISEDPSAHVKKAAVATLNNSLEFCEQNFQNEVERNTIMSFICNATLQPEADVKVAAIQCLVRIVDLYYEQVHAYMREGLYPITIAAIQSDNMDAVKQGIEFWTTVADVEIELQDAADEARDRGETPEHTSKHYCQGALEQLLPNLLKSLAVQDEDDDEDEFTVSKAAAVCLASLSECCGDPVFNACVPFVEQNLANSDWRFRDASVLAFGNILRGPTQETVKAVTNQALLPLLGFAQDPSTIVQDSLAWMLGVICDLFPDIVLQPAVLPSVLGAMSQGLQSEPRVAVNVCHALCFLVEGAYMVALDNLGQHEEEVNTNALSSSLGQILPALFTTIDRDDVMESNLRSAAYEALAAGLQFSPSDCYNLVIQAIESVLSRLQSTVTMSVSSQDDMRQFAEVMSGLLSVLQTGIRRLGQQDLQMVAGSIVELLVQVLSSRQYDSSSVVEDALVTLDALVEGCQANFEPFVERVKPFVLEAIRQVQHGDTCFVAVGLAGDICRQLGEKCLPHCPDFMNELLQALMASEVDRKVKPAVLSAFNDVALAIGPNFGQFLGVVFNVLAQASQAAVDPEDDDEDTIEFLNELRTGLLEAYTGIVQAMAGESMQLTPALSEMGPQLQGLLNFMMQIAEREMSDEVVRLSCGMIGDLSQVFGKAIGPYLAPQYLQVLNGRAIASADEATRTMGKYMMHHAAKARA